MNYCSIDDAWNNNITKNFDNYISQMPQNKEHFTTSDSDLNIDLNKKKVEINLDSIYRDEFYEKFLKYLFLYIKKQFNNFIANNKMIILLVLILIELFLIIK
jgi:hypothetical protein